MPAPMSSSSPRSRHLLLRKESNLENELYCVSPIASVIEVDIETGEDICKELLVRVIGFCQADTGCSDWIGGQGCKEGCWIRIVLEQGMCNAK